MADLVRLDDLDKICAALDCTPGDLLQAVTAVLARHRIVAAELRMEQANLDDAFMALTTHEE